MKKFLFCASFVSLLLSNETKPLVNLEYIDSIEKGYKRDFYINEYLKGDITSEDAFNTLSRITNMNNKMFFNFAKKFKHDESLAVAQCMNMNPKSLVDTYADCIVSGLTIENMSKLSAIDLDLIKQKTEGKYPSFLKRLKILSSSIPFTKLIVQKKDEFYNIFFNVDNSFRTKYFNYKLPKRTFDKIYKDKKKFEIFLKLCLSNPKMNMLHTSLKDIDDSNLDIESSLLLAFNAIRLNDLNLATKYLNSAVLKTNDTEILDKIKFWQYQISQDKTILEELLSSNNLNFYSYLAAEILNKKFSISEYIQKDEFFDSQLVNYDKKRVALLYSIAKNESNFEPTLISKDFKVGIMQLESSFIHDISNSLGKTYNILEQFETEKNLEFANIHLNNLENSFKNPLLLALAYDGKLEYLKWNLKNDVFKTKSQYEPFLSLEFLLVNKLESKKRLLMDYVIYHNLLTKKKKEKLSLLSICQNLSGLDQK